MAFFSITSETNQTKSSSKDLFEFLSDFKNFGNILPADKVDNFDFTSQHCSFNIKGITPLTIKLVQKDPYSSLIFESEGLAKFNFRLKVSFTGENRNSTTCTVELTGDMNPFIRSMAERPLKELVNTMSLKLSQLSIEPQSI